MQSLNQSPPSFISNLNITIRKNSINYNAKFAYDNRLPILQLYNYQFIGLFMQTDSNKDETRSRGSEEYAESIQLKDKILAIQSITFPSIQLNQPNQILPPNMHIEIIQKVSFKYKHQKDKSLFNYTTTSNFPVVSTNHLEFNKANASFREKNKNIIQDQDLLNQDDLGEMQGLLHLGAKKLIYQRINNKMFNFINARDTKPLNKIKGNPQNRYFCSVFINPKIQKHRCQAKPLYEQLTKIYNINDVTNFEQDPLVFSSKFQSGNLFAVFKDTNNNFPTYELFMQNDINTKGSNQWFCFNVFCKQRMKVKFKIMNFYKPSSLYEVGMKILISTDFKDWKRVGTAISYIKTAVQDKIFYALEFVYQFQSSSKPTYFSYGFPYTYSHNLSDFIDNTWRNSQAKKCLTKITLCKTTLGSSVYMFNITNNIQTKKVKPLIYIIGRQHPGQTPPSYIIQGLTNFLLSSRLQANALRQSFQFKIVPMVNIDGVVNGNYRTNISGNDINRQWMYPSKSLHPQIFYLKQEILSNKKNVVFFLDIHAHSRKMNSFFYGSPQISKQNKFYPFVCSKLSKFVNYSDCSFGDDSSKKTTARVVLQKQLNILNSITFQISFYGWVDQAKKQKQHFKIADFQQIGSTLALAFYYSQIGIKRLKQANQQSGNQIKTDKQKQLQKNSMKIYQKWKKQLQKQMKLQQALSQGSSIDPQHFQLNQQEQKLIIERAETYLKQASRRKHKQKYDISLQPQQNTKSIQTDLRSRREPKKNKEQIDINDSSSPKNSVKQSNLFSYSGKEFFLMSSKNFMVKKLESELQCKNDIKKSIQTEKKLGELKLGKGEAILNKRFLSLQSNAKSSYREDVLQIKKAYRYCLQSNDTGYGSIRSCYKPFNNNAIPFQKRNQLSPMSLSITQTPKNKFKINQTRYYKKF